MIIEQAKGVLAERHKVTVDEAFAILRDFARSHNLHLSDLARDVANGSTPAALLTDPVASADFPLFSTATTVTGGGQSG